MIYTDACVHPYPAGDSSVRRFALEAKELGLDSIVCTGMTECGIYYGVHVLRGMIIHESSMKHVIGRVKKSSGKADIIMVDAGDASFNRAVISYPGVNVLRGVHHVHKKAFDHISARNAAEKGVAIDVDLYPLIHDHGHRRQKAIQCYIDLMRLYRKYEFPITISSNATSWLDLRSIREMSALCRLFGMEEEEVIAALGSVDHLMHPDLPVKVIE